jgi:HK97 family phage major capsid protein
MAKDMNELLEERKVKVAELEAITAKGKTENRKLDTDEGDNFAKLQVEIVEIDKQLEEKRNLKNKNNIIIKTNNTMDNNKFSLIRTIRNVVEGRPQDEADMSILEAGKLSFRDSGVNYRGQIAIPMEAMETRANTLILAGTTNEGKEIVATNILQLLPYLRANLVLAKAGMTILSNLTGNIQIPLISTGATAIWQTESGAASVAGQGFATITLSPKRITAYYDVSKQFLQQSSGDAEGMLQQDLMASLMDLLEKTALGTAVGSATQPVGMFYLPTYAFTGASTFAGIISMESAVTAANALKNGASYLFHPSTIGVLKGTPRTPTYGNSFIAENSLVNGYSYYTTTNLPTVLSTKKAALFGDFSSLVMGQWGGLDLTIDPYSQAINGMVRVVANFYVDIEQRRTVAFGKAALS